MRLGLVFLLVGCAGEPPCEPAAAATCFCDGGFPGNHTCDAEGTWTECYCPFMGVDDTDDGGEPLAGEPDYVTYCSPCHGIQGLGTGDGPSLVQRVPALTDEELATVIREGRGRMPAFRSFSDADVADLVEFLRVSFGE